ncbi:putative peptidase YgaJ [Cytophagales bacterium WSM2-2]|nr:putative peptidase YgaJ [Cytophagales bacterium WSM2-2]
MIKYNILILIFVLTITAGQAQDGNTKKQADKIIFVGGSGLNKVFINYVASLTNKLNPKVCFIPTATGDNPNTIIGWYTNCEDLPLRPYVLRTYINSPTSPKSFEEIIMSMDAIIVGGGNTLNMIAIWKAHGIDTVLKKAYEKGIVMAGGSAGSLCWFTGGSTDSRPKELTIVEGLGFLNFSHSPHYLRETTRRPLYQQLILSGKLKAGYACDDQAGLLFVNGVVKKSVAQNAENHNYFVSLKDGKINEELLPAEIIK